MSSSRTDSKRIAESMKGILAARGGRIESSEFGQHLRSEGYAGNTKDFLKEFSDEFERPHNTYICRTQSEGDVLLDSISQLVVEKIEAEGRIHGGVLGTLLKKSGYYGTIKDFLAETSDVFEHRRDNYVYCVALDNDDESSTGCSTDSTNPDAQYIIDLVRAMIAADKRISFNLLEGLLSMKGYPGSALQFLIECRDEFVYDSSDEHVYSKTDTRSGANEQSKALPTHTRRALPTLPVGADANASPGASGSVVKPSPPASNAATSTTASRAIVIPSTAASGSASTARVTDALSAFATTSASTAEHVTTHTLTSASAPNRTGTASATVDIAAIPFEFVDSPAKLLVAQTRMSLSDTVAIDCEWAGDDEAPTLALIQIHASAAHNQAAVIYILDALSPLVGPQCVQLLWSIVCDETVTKIFHDARHDIDILRRSIGGYASAAANLSELTRITDIQVMYGHVRYFEGEANKRRAGFNEVMDYLGLPANPFKEAMHARFDLEPDLWTRRPMERQVLAYAAWDVRPLLDAHVMLRGRVAEAALALVQRGTSIAVEEYRQSTHSTRGGQVVRLDEVYRIDGWNVGRKAFMYSRVDPDGGTGHDTRAGASVRGRDRARVDGVELSIAVHAGTANTVVDGDDSNNSGSGGDWAQQMTREDEANVLLSLLPDVMRASIEAKCAEMGAGCESLCEVRIDHGKPISVLFNDDAETQHTFDGVEGSVADVIQALRERRREGTDGRGGQGPLFGRDNRTGIEGTLHRISAIRDKHGDIVGITFRIGHAETGSAYILSDVIASVLPALKTAPPKSLLIVGRPGAGKTTLLRDISRRLADVHGVAQRVVIVDTSGEIGGEGQIAHVAVGRARRMHVPGALEDTLIEAVQNHNPRVLVVDEIGHASHVRAVRTIAQRGTALVGTAHGTSLASLMKNPDMTPLVGGLVSMPVGDAMAQKLASRGGFRKTITERQGEPVFARLVEIQERRHVIVHWDVAATVDTMLGNAATAVREERWYDAAEGHWRARFSRVAASDAGRCDGLHDDGPDWMRKLVDKAMRVGGSAGAASSVWEN